MLLCNTEDELWIQLHKPSWWPGATVTLRPGHVVTRHRNGASYTRLRLQPLTLRVVFLVHSSAASRVTDTSMPATRMHKMGITSIKLMANSRDSAVLCVLREYTLFQTFRTPELRIVCNLQHSVQKVFVLVALVTPRCSYGCEIWPSL
jgi:hypothetical protein